MLLTASTRTCCEALLENLYDVSIADYVGLASLHEKDQNQKSEPMVDIVPAKDEDELYFELSKTIRHHCDSKPIIVFANKPKQFDAVKKFCHDFKIQRVVVRSDEDLQSARALMSQMTAGVLIVSSDYGRGADLRFACDSHVIVPYQLATMSELHQLTGRSSRTGGQAYGTLIYQTRQLDAEAIERCLSANDAANIDPTARNVKVMRGRRLLACADDNNIKHLFEKGCAFAHENLVQILGQAEATTFENSGKKGGNIGLVNDRTISSNKAKEVEL